ncbi:hypothetical protein AGMMS49938_10440 [Fibrobacterales bacterium]|nr:hypothetical protein AGMMS49938_10440 [Fibrobacterales bacterium]
MHIMPFIFILAFFAVSVQANFDEPKKFYVFGAGIDFAVTRGDLDGISKINSGAGSVPEKVILPEVPFFAVYAFDARALVDANSIAFNLGLGFPDYEHNLQNGEARYFRLGLEYQYHFLYPEPLRIGIGIGYTFSSLRFPKAAIGSVAGGEANDNSQWNYANFTGNGFHLVTSAEYFFTEHLATEVAIRYRLLYLNRVSTDLNDVSRLSDAVWQGMGELGLRFLVVF